MSTTMQTQAPEVKSPNPGTIRPSRAWYWAAGALAVAGLVTGLAVAVFGYLGALDEFEAFARLSVPGATEVLVEEPSVQVIYHQGDGFTGPAELDLSVSDPSGAVVDVDAYGSELIFHAGEGQVRAVATFDADVTGAYRVDASGVAEGRLAVGPSWAWIALPPVFGGLALAGIGLMAGALMWLVTIVRRSNAAARLRRTELTT